MLTKNWCLAVHAAAFLSLACDASRAEFPVSPDARALEGGALRDGRSDGPLRDAVALDADPADVGTGPLSSVRVGLVPVPKSSGDAGPTPVDQTDAVLDVLAAGSRGVSFVRRWDSLFVDGTQPRAAVWNQFASLAPVFRDQERSILFALGVVDRTADARPGAVDGVWDANVTETAMQALVDKTYGTFGSELAYLSVGTEIDRYLDTLTDSERGAFVAFVNRTLDYARNHPNRPMGTQVGVTVTVASIVQKTIPEVLELIDASDIAIATYYPLEESFEARHPSGAANDLDELAVALSDDAGTRTVVLQEVGYPSAAETGSSEDQQRVFFDGLFQALLARREQFPFVSINGLHDAHPEVCGGEASALGAPGDPLAIAARCSFGVRHADGGRKTAWSVVLDGMATFAVP